MGHTVSRKDCTVKSSIQKKRRREGYKWNRTAHLLEKYIPVLLIQLGNKNGVDANPYQIISEFKTASTSKSSKWWKDTISCTFGLPDAITFACKHDIEQPFFFPFRKLQPISLFYKRMQEN